MAPFYGYRVIIKIINCILIVIASIVIIIIFINLMKFCII